MTRFLAARNAPLSSVKAVVLTHYHPDHMGNRERLRQAGAAVLVHHDDRAAAMHRGRPSLCPLWKPPVLHLVGQFLRNGVARTALVAEASGFADEEVLDVPGRPRVIHTPGHTAGNAALSLADREVLIVGDTLATLSLSSGESGPQLLPRFLNEDHDRALASLEKTCPVTVGRLRLRDLGRPGLPSAPPSAAIAVVPGAASGQLVQTWNSETWPAGHPVLAVKFSRT
jgi:glyoxylase-like metal-dependent hydrolase (beta-lactamase superfamily II)